MNGFRIDEDARARGCSGFFAAQRAWLVRLLAVLLLVSPLAALAGTDTQLDGDDLAGGPYPIGFSFRFYGQDYTDFNPTTNGFIQFAAFSAEFSNDCLPSANESIAGTNTIFAFWDDLMTRNGAGGPVGRIFYETRGEAPNRQLIVEWSNMYFVDGDTLMGTFEAVLYEGTNQIKLQYLSLPSASSTGASATIGIQGGSDPTQFAQHSCNQANAIAPGQAILFTPDASGTSYQIDPAAPFDFVDIVALPDRPLPGAPYGSDQLTWTWMQSPGANAYEIEIQNDDGDAVLDQVLGDVGSFVWSSGFVDGQTYRARVRDSSDGGATWGAWSDLSDPVTVDQTPPIAQITSATQASLTSARFTYTSSDTASGIAALRLQIAGDAEFQTLLVDTAVSVDSSQFIYTGATPGAHLFARLRAADAAGNQSVSDAVELQLIAPPPPVYEPSTVPGINTGLNGDDLIGGPFPIGFTFRHFGQSFTQFFVTTNGLIQFASPTTAFSNNCLPPNGPGLANTILVFWDDLRTNVAGQPTGKIQYLTQGEAPNRRLVVQWTNQYFFGSNLPMGTFQAVLFEGTNEVKFQYRFLRDPIASTGGSATIGIQGANAAQVVQHSCNQANAVAPEQALSFLPDGTGTSYTLNTFAPFVFFDISGLVPDPPAPTARFASNQVQWTWEQLPDLNAYQLEIQTDAGQVVATQTLGNVGSFVWTSGFTPGETYRARVRGSVNGGATWEVFSRIGAPVTIDQVAPVAQMTQATQTGASTVQLGYAVSDALSGVASILLQIASDPAFQNLLSNTTVPAFSSSQIFGTATPGQHLYARVQGTDAAGNISEFSNVLDVVVVPPPTAAFTPNVLTGEAPLTVAFQNTSTGGATSFSWTFGNGQTSSQANPSVRYTNPGTFTVTLRATNVAGFTEASQTITVTPDITRPVVTPLLIDGGSAPSPYNLTQAKSVDFSVSDASGVAAVSATFAGQTLPVTSLGGGNYRLALDPDPFANGSYVLQITGQDIFGNVALTQLTVVIDLPPPPAPTVTAPAAGFRTNQTHISVSGTSALGKEALVFVNGVAQGDWIPVVNQRFTAPADLVEGANAVTAQVRNIRGTSPMSAAIAVTLDTSKPAPPSALAALAQPQGKVHLTWTASTDPRSQGTVILRAAAPFDSDAQATRVNASPLRTTSFDDLPGADGIYYYRVASVNDLGTLSLLSNQVQASADSVAPKATRITYTPLGRVDPATGRTGQGRVDVVLEVSEPLAIPPFLSIVPQGGQPIAVDLTATSPTQYSGFFVIDASTPSGVANALFSARDAAGNRGTDVEAGASLRIDAEGPALTAIAIAPTAPIRNDAAPAIQATFTFSEATKPGATPQIFYTLSRPGRSPITLSGLAQIDPATWRASFTLPADAGQGTAETFSFGVQVLDDLDNVSTRITAANRFQVYQGELPPADVPLGLTAAAQPGGKVRLAWQPVADAIAYQLYRQAPGETVLTPLARAGGVTYIDATSADGRYFYAVASVRQANGQETVSGQSAAVEVLASASAPGAPQNLALELTGQGIRATWQAPVSGAASYNLYRAPGTVITSIAGLAPLKTGIKGTFTVDATPSSTESVYVVTALDAAGNESAISNSSFLDASLLPVVNLKIEQIGDEQPHLTWSAPNASISGYLVYVGPDDARVRLTPTPITATSFVDTGYSGGERRYTVASVDAAGVEMPRSLVLPSVVASIAAGVPIRRGIMNKVQVQVANLSATALANAHVSLRVPTDRDATQFRDHRSDAFDLGANQTLLAPVVVGGYAGLPAQAQVELALEVAPNEGELARVVRNVAVDVGDSTLVVGMTTDAFVRGGSGKVKLDIDNTSEVDVELLTATNNSADPSTELRFKLLDADGNVLATQSYKQAFGAGIVPLANGLTVVRIPAGTRYLSDPFSIDVPASSPTQVRVRVEVDTLRYHSGAEDEIQIAGRGSERTVTLVDTAYTAEVTSVAPETSFGDQDILISGRALDRATGAPVPNARVKLILNQQGFERGFSVVTDATGSFTYAFTPTLADGGVYQVSAVHPDITQRPEQKAFTINRILVGPNPFKVDVPRNYAFSIPLTAKAGVGTAATNLRLALDPASQPTGQLPAGIALDLPAPISIAERQTLNVPVLFVANNEAQPSGSIVFDVLSDEHPTTPITRVRVDYALSDAKPFLTATPSFVETGVSQGANQIETLTLENKGLQDALNLQVALTSADGTPAPVWAAIATDANGTLAVGAKRAIDLSFTPPPGTQDGVYELKLTVQGDNVPPQSFGVFASVTQSGVGSVLFKAADIFTATVDKDGKLIPGLANADIVVQNEDVATVSQELLTDGLGEALFQNLPAGRYKFRARATNHQETAGRFQVKPGITLNQSVFLNYNVITVEWSVREITIQDRYEITLNATFETDVPAPVVVLQPSSVNLPLMSPGDVFYGELTVTNFGLVRADNVRQTLPQSDAFFRYEFLSEVPPSLEAKQRVTLPYRVVALQWPDTPADSGAASGGGCFSYSATFLLNYSFVCANGDASSGSTSTSWFAAGGSAGTCGTGGPKPGGGGFGGIAPHGTPIKGMKCVGLPDGRCDDE